MKVTEQQQERRFILELGAKELFLIKDAMQYVTDNGSLPHPTNYRKIALGNDQLSTLKALLDDIQTAMYG